eukprot:UN08026
MHILQKKKIYSKRLHMVDIWCAKNKHLFDSKHIVYCKKIITLNFKAGKSFDRSALKDFKAEGYNEATELRKVIDRVDE